MDIEAVKIVVGEFLEPSQRRIQTIYTTGIIITVVVLGVWLLVRHHLEPSKRPHQWIREQVSSIQKLTPAEIKAAATLDLTEAEAVAPIAVDADAPTLLKMGEDEWIYFVSHSTEQDNQEPPGFWNKPVLGSLYLFLTDRSVGDITVAYNNLGHFFLLFRHVPPGTPLGVTEPVADASELFLASNAQNEYTKWSRVLIIDGDIVTESLEPTVDLSAPVIPKLIDLDTP